MKTYYKSYYGIPAALRHRKKVEELVIFLEDVKDDPSQLEQIAKFENLKSISFLDGKWLTALPNVLLELKHLKYLRIRQTGITDLSPILGQLSLLEDLVIEHMPLTHLPAELDKLTELECIDISDTPITVLPNSIGQLKKLERLYLRKTPLTHLPDSIVGCEKLRILSIRQTPIKQLPDAIGQLQNLEQILLDKSAIKQLPDSMTQLQQLTSISFRNSNLTTFPAMLSQCKALKTLQLRSNKITTIPEGLLGFYALEDLDLVDNPIAHFPSVLLEWWSQIGSDPKKMFYINPSLYANCTITKLFKSKYFAPLDRVDKQYYFDLYCNHLLAIEKIPTLALQSALNAKISLVADHALTFLTQNTLPILTPNSEIVLLGKTKQPKKELVTKLEACGLKTSTKLSPNTTHIMVSSRSNKGLDKLPNTVTWNWITEAQLMQYIDQVNPAYLVEAAQETEQDASTHGMIEQVQTLIMTLEEENMALGIELITGGGLPVELLTEVFIVFKLSANPTTRKKAKILLEKRATPALLQVFRNRSVLRKKKGYYPRAEHEKMCYQLLEYTADTPIDLGKLAYAVYMQSSLALTLALDYTTRDYQRKVIAQKLDKDTYFAFNHYDKLTYFPALITEFPQTTHIVLYGNHQFRRQPAGQPQGFTIPSSIQRLKALEELHIYYVLVDEIDIDALTKLPKLKSLRLQVDSQAVANAIVKALPNCTVDIRVVS